jgi:hypothetical protein
VCDFRLPLTIGEASRERHSVCLAKCEYPLAKRNLPERREPLEYSHPSAAFAFHSVRTGR